MRIERNPSLGEPVHSASSRLATPRKSATYAVAGCSYTCSGVPTWAMWPPSITARRSDIVSASSWSWVTYTNVMPTSSCNAARSCCSSLRSLASSAPSGSSSSSTDGCRMSARASATRCCCPPDSCAGRRFSNPPRRTSSIARPTRRSRSARPSRVAVASPSQAVGDVVGDAEVREQRVRLEHRVDRSAMRAACRRGRRRRGGCFRWSAARSRRSSAASWSCRSPTARGARRTRRARSRDRCRRRRRNRRTPCAARLSSIRPPCSVRPVGLVVSCVDGHRCRG